MVVSIIMTRGCLGLGVFLLSSFGRLLPFVHGVLVVTRHFVVDARSGLAAAFIIGVFMVLGSPTSATHSRAASCHSVSCFFG